MQNQATPSPPPARTEDEISLIDLIHMLWRRRWLIFSLAGLGALLGLGASLASLRYVSEALFLTNIPIEAYKRYENAVLNGPQLMQFVRKNGAKNAAATVRLLEVAGDAGTLGEAIRVESSFTDKDIRGFGGQAGKENTLFFRLRCGSPEPAGNAQIALLGEFVRDAIIRVDMDETIPRQCNGEQIRERALRNAQIQNEFDIRQEEQRVATLRTLVVRHGDSRGRDTRQVVRVEKDTERFLPLPAQLVAAEIRIADMRLANDGIERERETTALRRDYYCKAQEALQARPSGRAFLTELGNIQQAVFEGKDRNADVIEKTWNELELQRREWTGTYLDFMRFVVPPDGGEVRERKPGIALGMVLGGVLGGVLGSFWVLMRRWWRGDNR